MRRPHAPPLARLAAAVAAAAALAVAVSTAPGVARAEPVAAAGQAVVARRVALDDGPTRGPRGAPVTVEVFCPWRLPQCARALQALDALVARHPGRLRIVYRQVSHALGPDALTFAQAAVEAWAQGRFLEFQAQLYARQTATARRDLEPIATAAGLDLAALRAALADGRHRALVARDEAQAVRLGAERPPALVWNGIPALALSPSADSFEALYRQALARAEALLSRGVPPHRIYPALLREATRRRAEETLGRGSVRHGGPARTPIDLAARRHAVALEGAPARGAADAEVTVILFADFPCRACGELLRGLARLEDALAPRRLRVVYKHFPMPYANPDSKLASTAAACAALQGRFWPFVDEVYAGVGRLNRERILAHARAAGLDVDRLVVDLDAGRCAAAIEADQADGRALGIERTPTVFVNGLRLAPAASASEVRLVVEDELRPGLLELVSDPAP